ncbi:AraC family transcriptional regulator [Chitinophaga sp. CB10]|uniref:helix-turn-helix domain-containing protein n=1 Tax=Chitinophaga sp. CB10 TaxID=1891659 RepID=UPI0025BE5C69|nr:helix-turn-helix domain-containing protein [Chitinophaga sp. CB10]
MIYIISIGAFQALTAALLLWKKRLSDKADVLLILLLICIATHLGIKFYIYGVLSDAHIRNQMNTFIGLCYGPLAYLYLLKRRDEHFIPATQWYHFLPFVLVGVGYLTVACLLYAYAPVGYEALDIYNSTSTWLFIASGSIYPVLILKRRKELSPGPERKLITHIGALLLLLAVVSIFFTLFGSVLLRAPLNIVLCRFIVYTLLSLICIDILRHKYTGISITENLLEQEEEQTPVPAELPPSPVAEGTSAKKMQLSAEEHLVIWQKLEQHLRKTMLYVDADLTLDKLSDAIGESKYHVSETLNAYAHKTFYQYINEYRILRAAELITAIQQKGLPVNILTIAYESGFKAKSSFNAYFKKIIGETPSAYLNRQKANLRRELMNA